MTTTMPPDTGTRTTAIASVVDARKTYGEGEAAVHALDGVSVDFMDGEFTAIMGASGSGKSTLLHCTAALDTLTSGEVTLAGRSLSACSEQELTLLRRDHIGFIFQQFNLMPMLTMRDNILLPLRLAEAKVDEEWFATVVGMLGIESRLTHLPRELSGGQQQRVAVARALIARPSIVFGDEPTGALDSKSGSTLLSFLRQAVDTLGQTIVMVTHDAHAAAHADRVIYLADGHIVDEMTSPTTEAVLDRLKRLER